MTTTKALWEKKIAKMEVVLPPLPNPRGEKIDCLNGCGNKVSKAVGICRACRRDGKRRVAKVQYRQRKDASKKKG